MTKVIFRVDERDNQKEIIAVFPELAGDMNAYKTCGGYVHMGQHVTISADIPDWTRPATPEEYQDLLAELVSIGYDDLRVVKKMTRQDLEKRKEQVRA